MEELPKLIRSIERHAPRATALDRLERAVGLAEDLRQTGDELVDHFVSAARADGHSWSEIGAILGVTKQAAQQRFVPGRVPYWPPKLDEAVHHAITAADGEARALGHNYMGTEHVLLGLLMTDSGLAREALERLGVTAEGVRAGIVRTIGRGHLSGATLGVTPRLKRALERARKEARRLGHRCGRPEHVLLALSADRAGVAAQLLAEAGADEASIREALAGLLAAEAPELADRIRHPRRPRRRARG